MVVVAQSSQVLSPGDDGSEIRRKHQLRLEVEIPLFTTGFSTIQTVVGNGISEPSTVRNPSLHLQLLGCPGSRKLGWINGDRINGLVITYL